MARYSGAERERRIEASRLVRQVTAIFAACRIADDDAVVLADPLVQADVRGIHSHGVLRVATGLNTAVARVGRPESFDEGGMVRGELFACGAPPAGVRERRAVRMLGPVDQ